MAVAGPEPLLLAAPRFCGAPHQLAVRVAYEIACVAYEAAYVAYEIAFVAYEAAYVACLQRLTDVRYALLVILWGGGAYSYTEQTKGGF